jgi:hypothetical protein
MSDTGAVFPWLISCDFHMPDASKHRLRNDRLHDHVFDLELLLLAWGSSLAFGMSVST